jgi:hypothetical protein
MSVHQRAKCAAMARPRAPFRRRVMALAGLVLATLATACAGPPPMPIAGPDPSDPSARAKAVGYRSTLAPYATQRPVEPKPWLEQNQQVAPAPRPSDRP